MCITKRKQIATKIENGDARQNGMRTICTSAVLNEFWIVDYRYSQTLTDVVNLLRRNGYAVRSRKSACKGATVGKVRGMIRKISKKGGKFLVFVDRHVLLLNSTGKTIVDTDPRVRDARKIIAIYEVYEPKLCNECDKQATKRCNRCGRELCSLCAYTPNSGEQTCSVCYWNK